MIDWNCGCGCIGIIPVLIAFGIALALGKTFLVALGVACITMGAWMVLGNIVYIAGELLFGTR